MTGVRLASADMDEPTPLRQLASILLNQPVQVWILERRGQGDSWRRIARDLSEFTGGKVDVTYETLRAWAGQEAA